MANYTIELLPVKEQVVLSPAEWQIVVLFCKYPDIDILKEKANLSSNNLNTILARLQKKRVLKVIENRPAELQTQIPSFFWERIEKELSKSIGPIASLVLDDKVDEFNVSKENFPSKYLYSLVEKVASEINSQEEKNQFQKTMLEFIKQYL